MLSYGKQLGNDQANQNRAAVKDNPIMNAQNRQDLPVIMPGLLYARLPYSQEWPGTVYAMHFPIQR